MDPFERREILEYEREMRDQARMRGSMAGIGAMPGPPTVRPRMAYEIAKDRTKAETKTNKLLLLEEI